MERKDRAAGQFRVHEVRTALKLQVWSRREPRSIRLPRFSTTVNEISSVVSVCISLRIAVSLARGFLRSAPLPRVGAFRGWLEAWRFNSP